MRTPEDIWITEVVREANFDASIDLTFDQDTSAGAVALDKIVRAKAILWAHRELIKYKWAVENYNGHWNGDFLKAYGYPKK